MCFVDPIFVDYIVDILCMIDVRDCMSYCIFYLSVYLSSYMYLCMLSLSVLCVYVIVSLVCLILSIVVCRFYLLYVFVVSDVLLLC